MKFYSTKNKKKVTDLKTTVIRGMPQDGGLFMPVRIPQISEDVIAQFKKMEINDIGKVVLKDYIDEDLEKRDFEEIIDEALNFETPIKLLTDQLYVLELFHGPTLAFKDFGARFMSRLLSKLIKNDKSAINIVVATSGDTGSAVASGFFNVEGIRVFILYPSQKISDIQKKQITTYGNNIYPLEIEGNFDDCQKIVKTMLRDQKISSEHRITTTNSINIARLLPQLLYYFKGVSEIGNDEKPFVCVPSGNFGNLCAGLIAKKMGLGIHKFIAATNINDVVPRYLETGVYHPKDSKRTLSNAMDVGDPSNFERILEIYNNNQSLIKNEIIGMAFSDSQTKVKIKEVYQKYRYLLDPHGAVGFLALEKTMKDQQNSKRKGITLETAHPAKFKDEMEKIIGEKIEIPYRLNKRLSLNQNYQILPNEYEKVRDYFMDFCS